MGIKDLYKQMCGIISDNPNSDAEFEADQLIEFVTGKRRMAQLWEDIDATTAQKLLEMSQRRKEGYPLQYMLGFWEFFDMELEVGEGVLIPRGDTETVCEAAFKVLCGIENPKVIDLCSGSGCIALAVKRFFPSADVVAVEKSDAAFGYLLKNREKTGFDINAVQGDVFGFENSLQMESFDLIISNPPYIAPEVKATIQKEVSFEPEMALFCEDNGLVFYKYISKLYKDILKPGGYLVFEYGYDQQKAVCDILTDDGYTVIEEIIDLGGNPRGIVTQRPL